MLTDALVKTPIGTKYLSTLKAGDFLCNELGNPVQIKQISTQKAPVVDLLIFGHCWVTCSQDHPWLVKETGGFVEVRQTSEFKSCNRILTKFEDLPFKSISVQVGMQIRVEDTFQVELLSNKPFYLLNNGLIAHEG